MAELFLKIVNMSIAAGWLVLVVAIARLLLKKAPKWVNPLLWGIVGLRLVLPFSIESVLSLIPSAEPISPKIMYMPEPVITSGFPVVNEIVNPVITENFAPKVGSSVNPLQIFIPIAAAIWMIGIAGMLIYTAVSYFRLHHRIKTSVLLCRNIYQSEQVETPFVLGMMHPHIYLPFKLEEENLAYVIAHEESHIHRRDNWTKPLGFLLLSVYWFHPLIWLGYILFCRDIELACDERVIKEMNHEERAGYSQALLNCSVSRRMISASPLTFSEVDVKERVKRVLTYKKPAFLLTVTAVCVCGVIAVCFLTNPKTISATGEDGSTAIIGGADGPTKIEILSPEEKAMQDFLGEPSEIKHFSAEDEIDLKIVPLEKEEVLAAMEKSGLKAEISDEETQSVMPGHISYVLRSLDETYNNTENKVIIGSVSYFCQADLAPGRRLAAIFMSVPGEDVSKSVFSWDDWKQQLAFAAMLYGGFDDTDEIYEVFSAMGLPADQRYSWDAQLSGGYCQIEWRDSGMSQSLLNVLIYENKAYFDAYQELRQKAVSPFLVEVTSAEIVENNDGKKELALSVAIENDTVQEWQGVWFECRFNREAGAFIADHFVNGYESDKVDVVAAKNDESSDIHGLEYEWYIPLTTEEDLAYNYDYLSMEDIYSAFREITVTVHAYGKKQIVVIPLKVSDYISAEE